MKKSATGKVFSCPPNKNVASFSGQEFERFSAQISQLSAPNLAKFFFGVHEKTQD